MWCTLLLQELFRRVLEIAWTQTRAELSQWNCEIVVTIYISNRKTAEQHKHNAAKSVFYKKSCNTNKSASTASFKTDSLCCCWFVKPVLWSATKIAPVIRCIVQHSWQVACDSTNSPCHLHESVDFVRIEMWWRKVNNSFSFSLNRQ